ncbi:MAG: FlgD immunoglobulin-like domain containing protein [Elusimicrobiota bacterium]
MSIRSWTGWWLFAVLCGTFGSSFAQTPSTLSFSPNKDGVKDEVTFKLKLDKDTAVSQWLFEIKDKAGTLVKSFQGKGRPPEVLQWEGKDMSDRLVVDGVYYYSLGLRTPAGNQTAIAPSPLIVDRVYPAASASVKPEIFSPNGDGIKDEAEFDLKADDSNGIYSWLLSIKDRDGAAARSIRGRGMPPAAVRWDGRGDFEEDVPDGAYTFELQVHDVAGNMITTLAQKIQIDRAGQASTVDVQPPLFSPNGDGYKDTVTLNIISAGGTDVARWELRIIDRNGKTAKEFSGDGEAPARIVWDGLLEKKKVAADGVYQVVLTENDRAGNKASSTPQPLEIDDTPPLVMAVLEPNLLSPNRDGVKDEGLFSVKAEDASPLSSWTLRVYNDVGRIMRTFKGPEGSKPREKIAWDGTDDNGAPLSDGSYTYALEAVDIAGNKALTAPMPARLDRTPPLLEVSAQPQLFSPNGDGVLDALTFKLGVADASPLEFWRLEARNAAGDLVRFFTGPADVPAPASVLWDGKNQDRAPLPDGEYGYILKAKDIVGNEAATPEQKVIIGATRPEPVLSSDLRAISPNADGFKDEALLSLGVKYFNKITEWSVRIVPKDAGEGEKAESQKRVFQGRGDVPGNLRWAGERDDKRPLPDGEYLCTLDVVDAAGNRSATPPQPVRIDTTKPAITIQVSPDRFSPNGDNVKDEAVFIPSYQDASPILDWTLSVLDAAKKVVWTQSGKEKLPLFVAWKGEDEKGARLPDGSYNYVFTAQDEVGNRSTTLEQIVRIDNTPPEVSLQVDPDLFSPNGDGVKDETLFQLDAKDASDISQWLLTVWQDKLVVKTFKGIGRPPKNFPWDGSNDRGRTVQDGRCRAVLSVTDEVGNTGESPEVFVRVDTSKPLVTVEAETDKLEELVPQMTVTQQNKDLVISLSSEVLFDTGQSKLKSQAYPTLMKAVHLVRRYPLRKVRIEGHADNRNIHNEEFKDNLELSRGRAQAVMQFFIERGNIEAARMSAEGYGDTRPRASNKTPEGQSQNRRVEIILKKEGS